MGATYPRCLRVACLQAIKLQSAFRGFKVRAFVQGKAELVMQRELMTFKTVRRMRKHKDCEVLMQLSHVLKQQEQMISMQAIMLDRLVSVEALVKSGGLKV
eukprot:SAG22_NODE_1661_length_3868_cov_5.701512_2_plen_101_part_00